MKTDIYIFSHLLWIKFLYKMGFSDLSSLIVFVRGRKSCLLLKGTFWQVKGKRAIHNRQMHLLSFFSLYVCGETTNPYPSASRSEVKSNTSVLQQGQAVALTASTNKMSCCHDTNKPCSSCVIAH